MTEDEIRAEALAIAVSACTFASSETVLKYADLFAWYIKTGEHSLPKDDTHDGRSSR
jgi:hypothetical protein